MFQFLLFLDDSKEKELVKINTEKLKELNTTYATIRGTKMQILSN